MQLINLLIPIYSKTLLDYEHCQPGKLGGRILNNYTTKSESVEECYLRLLEYAKEDLRKIGYELIESSYEEYINPSQIEECWKVAYCYSETVEDYHWYRLNSDGTWSHKKGMRVVTNLDNSGQIIYNPQFCDRGKYNVFVGFFMIKKISNNSNNEKRESHIFS